MPRATNTEERRGQIVNGLAQVMASKGYEGASVHAIAKAANLSPGLVHYHFKRKLEILLALVVELGVVVTARIDARTSETNSAEASLLACLDAFVEPGEDASPTGVACWVVICAEALREPEVAVVVDTVLRAERDRLQVLVDGAWRERGGCPDDATTLRIATSLLAGVQGSFTLVAAAPGAFPPGFAAPALKAMAGALLDEVTA